MHEVETAVQVPIKPPVRPDIWAWSYPVKCGDGFIWCGGTTDMGKEFAARMVENKAHAVLFMVVGSEVQP